jgi:adenylosuccinate synthase
MEINNVDICCGLAWGDEAKGKIVSELLRTKNYDWVCRWSGGSNAGHTIYIDNKKYVTHLIPAGVFYNIKCYIGPDCYINYQDFIEEINYLKNNGFNTDLIFISPNAHIITQEHIEEDLAKYKTKQGSTGKGIAPCAKDKFARIGKLVKDDDDFITNYSNNILTPELNGDILCEGAQGFWLDINYGNYPYVTSSNCLPYSACSLGFPPKKIRDIYGAAKIYDTRVGVDPLFDENSISNSDCDIIEQIIDLGEEYGSTTKRRRKVFWLNLDKLITAINISGTNIIVISKIDILEQVNFYKLQYTDGDITYDTIEDMKNDISNILYRKCKLLEKVIYSNNPKSIEEL